MGDRFGICLLFVLRVQDIRFVDSFLSFIILNQVFKLVVLIGVYILQF